MKNNYLAKSDGETIVEHTNLLLKNLQCLQEYYPEIAVNWEQLKIACQYHDLGKMNRKFQEKVQANRSTIDGEVPHGLLSTAFLPVKEWKKQLELAEIQALAYAIAYHHERDFSRISQEQYQREIELLKEEAVHFLSEQIGIDHLQVRKLSGRYYGLKKRLSAKVDPEAYPKYVMIKGLLNRIDHAASAHAIVEYPNNFLRDSMNTLNYTWNPLQEYMLENQENNLVVIAQTGMGKTEAGLLWLDNDKGFFTLPLRSAINAIYERIYTKIVTEEQAQRVGLLHSETFNQYLRLEQEELDVSIGEYENRTKQWALPLTICTLDQVFDFVYRYGGYEQKLATLSYSKIIVDEIQMYSADLLAYLIQGLKYITDYGGKFAILTATLPPFVTDLLQENSIPFKMPTTPFIDAGLPLRHAIEVTHKELQAADVLSVYKGQRVLVICNTIKKAKALYRELQQTLEKSAVHLLHSQFTKKDRANKEAAIMAFGQIPRENETKSGIWISTQIVEASLDIDFDLLLTELTDLNGLFQRMGRCYRKRPLEDSRPINVNVFDEKCTGIGYVVDRGLHELSKEALANVYGPLSESDKMTLLAETYTTEKVKETNFYKSVENNINYLNALYENEKNKAEVKNIFRNIHNTSVIPAPVYVENQQAIDAHIEILQQKNTKEATSVMREALRNEKKRARAELSMYKVDLPDYVLDRQMFAEPLVVSQYEAITILNCSYDDEVGVTLEKLEKEELFF